MLLGQGSAQHTPPSIHWDAPSLALCATPPVTLWVSQGAPQTTHPLHPSGVQSWAPGSCRSPNPQTPHQPYCRAPIPRCWAPSTGRTQPPPPTGGPQPAGEEQRCATVPWPCALNTPPPTAPGRRRPTYTGTAVSPSRQRLGDRSWIISSLGSFETRQPEVGTQSRQ